MNYDLPGWFTNFKPHQPAIIDQVVDAFDRVNWVVLEAPTGTGKTLIGECVRQAMKAEHDLLHTKQHRCVYVCTTKNLQRQFIDDFPYARLLQGKANYPTAKMSSMFPEISCDDCLRKSSREPSCRLCAPESCPYQIAKGRAVRANLAILNSAYWIRELNGISSLWGADLAIVDEADQLESSLLGFVEVRVPQWLREAAQVPAPAFKTKPESWDSWLHDHVGPAAYSAWRDAVALANKSPNLENNRRVRRRLATFEGICGIDVTSGRWVMDRDRDTIVFRPVWVDRHAPKALWRLGAAKYLLMSATVISAEIRMRSLGVKDGDWEFVRGPSVIDPRRRPVICSVPGVDMSYKSRTPSQDTWRLLAREIERVAALHPGVRTLVHSVSYDLTRFLQANLDIGRSRPLLCVTSTRERDIQLEHFRELESAVLIAPGFDRGLDLAHDLCRVAVWTKVPFPSLGDPQVSARLYGSGHAGRDWYAMETIATLVQGAGRVVRGESDWGLTYILDAQMSRILREHRGLIPGWFAEALDTTGGVRAYRGMEELGLPGPTLPTPGTSRSSSGPSVAAPGAPSTPNS